MTIRVHFFARIRESIGASFENVDGWEGMLVSDLLDELAERHDVVHAMKPSIRVGVNDRYVRMDHVLNDKDDVALLSPVSGG